MNKMKILFVIIAAFVITSCSNSDNSSLCPDDNHPHMIDLGLPNGTKWACCNVGAPLPEECGGYYSWGETEVKPLYNEETYRYGKKSDQIPQSMGNIAGSEFDAAHERLGSAWQMPTWKQFQELIDYCNRKWTKYNGHHGWMFTGPNGNTIFLPAGGLQDVTNLNERKIFDNDERGYYWACNLDEDGDACYLKFHNVATFVEDTYAMYLGYNIRAIANPDE